LSPDPAAARTPPERLALAVASGFGSGLVPFASGTAGSLVAVPLVIGWRHWAGDGAPYLLGCLLWAALAVICAGVAVRVWREPDPARVTVDEIAGMFVTFIGVPLSWLSVLAGLFFFRLYDVLKPFPARRLERLPGGWGVTLDDLVAGLYAAATIHLLLRLGLGPVR